MVQILADSSINFVGCTYDTYFYYNRLSDKEGMRYILAWEFWFLMLVVDVAASVVCFAVFKLLCWMLVVVGLLVVVARCWVLLM